MAYYKNLAGVDAIWNIKEPLLTDTGNLGLDIAEFSPANGHYIFSLLRAVNASNYANHEPLIPYPDEVATSLGLNSVTKDAYLSHLRTSGFDVEEILKRADECEREYQEWLTDKKNRAKEFFDLIQTQPHIADDDFRKLIDAQSIYDLLELVLDHADSTRARLKAIRMHEKDPKQADKEKVRELWHDWQRQPFTPDGTKKYKGNSAFAHDMLDKFQNLKSQPVIVRWCNQWAGKT